MMWTQNVSDFSADLLHGPEIEHEIGPMSQQAPLSMGAAHTADDREYLLLLYREHAAQARQQELLRSMWTAIAFTLIVGLLAYGAAETAGRREWVCGLLVCCASGLAAAVNQKHFERYELHLSIMRGFRAVLAHRVRDDIPKISMKASMLHAREHPISRRLLGLQGLWRAVYACTFLLGATMTWQGYGIETLAGTAPSISLSMPDHLPAIGEAH